MSKEIQVSKSNELSHPPTQTVLNQHGDSGVQILNQERGVINICQTGNNRSVYDATIAIDTEYYNLFVVGDETFSESCFIIDKARALTVSEGISPEISGLFARLSPDMIARIKTFPSLFTSLNRDHGRTDDKHIAFYGFVTGVNVQENGIKIHFQPACKFPQQRLNEIASSLEIQSAPLTNELNRTHWAIKKVNLIDSLGAAGFNVILPNNSNL